LSKRVLIGAAIVMAVLAVLDLIYERLKYRQNLRMSRQDIRDEYKQTEGSPEIKSKLRELRQERARNRMMQAVPEADVVITNPTHFAIALAYNMERMAAPKVVAKGQDFVALKIREIAEENEIPIVENPPLAQALYRSADIDEEIPLEHYQAVADVIRYVYALKNKKL
jgi:flagellar biosynthetic protein FlhB